MSINLFRNARIQLGFSLAVACLGVAPAAPAFGMLLTSEPVEMVTVVAPRRDGDLKAILSDAIGDVRATSTLQAPAGKPAAIAQSLTARSGAAREYGSVRLSAFRMTDESIAYALLRFLRPDGANLSGLGDDAWTSSREDAVRVGDVVVVASGGSSVQRAALAGSIVTNLGRPPVNSSLVEQLPRGGRVDQTERYVSSHALLQRFRPDVVDDVFRLGAGGADGVVADYDQPDGSRVRLLIVEYQTPQLATEADHSVRAWLETLDPAERASHVLKREGNFLVEATGVTSPEAVKPLVDAVTYDYQIKMLQGPSPAVGLDAAKEAYVTAMILLGSVRLVGAGALVALCIGILAGSIVFVRRRRAAADVFSDAGGMVHLELEATRPQLSGETRGLLPERSES